MLFAVPYHKHDTSIYGIACKLYMLLPANQLSVDSHEPSGVQEAMFETFYILP
jgi:hypothetical protein